MPGHKGEAMPAPEFSPAAIDFTDWAPEDLFSETVPSGRRRPSGRRPLGCRLSLPHRGSTRGMPPP